MIEVCLFVAGALLAAAAAHVVAARRHPSGDCGGFWAQVLDRLVLWLAVPTLLVSCFHDTTLLTAWLPTDTRFWLLVPLAAWLGIAGLGLWKLPEPDEGRWIAGSLEFSARRLWVLQFAPPFMLAAFFTAAPWQESIDAAHWAVLVLFLASLAGVASSASPTNVWAGIGPGTDTAPELLLSPWPDEMRSRGVGVRQIVEWEASLPPPEARGPGIEWQQRLVAVSPGISGVLCDAVAGLVSWEPRNTDPVAIILAPDHCGQEEITALLATELSRRHGETTLVVTAKPDAALVRRFERWLEALGGENPVPLHDMSRDGELPAPGSLVIADAETLSESVLDRLRSELQQSKEPGGGRALGSIGVAVWWNAHEFSGVLAAHVWAVSRRLERLLKSRRGVPGRALIFARRPAGHEAFEQIETHAYEHFRAFLEHLLPYEWRAPGDQRDSNAFTIPSTFSRRTHLYRLDDESPLATRNATEQSLLTDWPTLPPPGVVLTAAATRGVASAAEAGARILDISPSELLSLREILCHGGRSSPPGIDQHAALARPDNPYGEFVLSRVIKESTGDSSLHLVSPEGHPDLLVQHLLLALREVPDTLTGLRGSFHWEEAMLRRILQRLSADGRLSRVPVRFLDSGGRLQRDARYANQNPGQGAIRSFRIIGRGRPVELRDPNVQDRLLKLVDPERLPIDAYPNRTFWSDGRCYRVLPWSGPSPTRIDCRPEREIRTWRFATSRVAVSKRTGEGQTLRGLEVYPAGVTYSEDVTGVLERDESGNLQRRGIVNAVRTRFDTEALILKLTAPFGDHAILTAVAAMRHVLPVHLAVEDDTLDVHPLLLSDLRGLALVDLHPGGIGIVDALYKNMRLVPTLFDRVAEWLSQVRGQSGVQALSRSPQVHSLSLDRLDVDGALRLFASAAMHE